MTEQSETNKARRDYIIAIESVGRTVDAVRLMPIEASDWEELEPDEDPSIQPLVLEWIDSGTATLETALQDAPEEPQRWSALHWAIALRMSALSCELVRSGVNIEAQNARGERPLHFASAFDDTDTIGALLSAGADVNARSTEGYCAFARVPYADTDHVAAGRTALHHAADRGNMQIAERLLAAGADPAAADDQGVVPLMLAGNEQIVRMLLDRGVRVDIADDLGRQPIHYAAREGRLSALKALLDAGADLHALTSIRAGHTVLTYAIQKRVGKDVGATLDFVLKRGADVNQRAADKMTPLEFAVRENDPTIVARLLDAGADINASSYRGEYPLLSSFGYCGGDRSEVTSMLIRAGADVNVSNFKRESALTLAANRACSTRVKMLLAAGASINHADRDGWTALHHAARHVRTDILATLLAAGANRDALDKKGRRPIDLANGPQTHALLETT